MRLFQCLFGSALILLSGACSMGPAGNKGSQEQEGNLSFTRYASGFRVTEKGAGTMVEVLDPWQQSRDVIFSYMLASDPVLVPDSLKSLPFIRTPVQRVIALSTTHVAMIDQLGCGESIVGLSGSGYIYSASIRKRIESGSILDVGYGQGLDYEKIVGLEPDVIFLYGVEGSVLTILEKLTELGIPAVFCGEYLENHPLGKAEWIRFFSLFYNREVQSARFFDQVDSAYCSLAERASGAGDRPEVLMGLPWKDTWFMAGGESYAARLVEDAGGHFLWSDHPSTQAIPLDLESVYIRAVNADIWINPGEAASLADIVQLDERFGELPVVKSGSVFNNDARRSPGGGNDYWESGTVRPDLVLADLIGIFHPDLLTDHQFVFYRQLK